ncbi:MAG: ABC transporter ATP-binding protein [Roseiflexaceae bacterium]|nr:ABC transporter ATP-binding protein [Roseiflexaceae bacterium]
MSLIETSQLSKTYGSGPQAVYALSDANVKIEQGEFVAIMGPSGSGKSTLLYLMGGLDRPSGGKVTLAGNDLSTLGDKALSQLRRQKLGLVFQFFNLLPVLSAQENVAMPLLLDGVARAMAMSRAQAALSQVGVGDRLTHRPAELSGGQQQRVAIARALVINPTLILADEPTGNLDSTASDEIITLLRRAVDEWGRTMVMVTHDPRIAAHADRIIFLKDGRIIDENRMGGQSSADAIRERLGRMALV